MATIIGNNDVIDSYYSSFVIQGSYLSVPPDPDSDKKCCVCKRCKLFKILSNVQAAFWLKFSITPMPFPSPRVRVAEFELSSSSCRVRVVEFELSSPHCLSSSRVEFWLSSSSWRV